jgi:two-component system, cell cycle sensor histidine kinase and response regulator CckA
MRTPFMTLQGPLSNGEPARAQTTKPQGATEMIYRRLFEATEAPGNLAAGMPRGKETILLVEDTVWLRGLFRRVLQTCGYTVLEAAHGEEAIQLTGTHPGTVHLLLSDLVLPGIGGRGLAERIGALKPGIKVLYISGYTVDAVHRHGLLESDTAFLHKPFSPRLLAGKVRAVLDTGNLNPVVESSPEN